MAIYQEKNINNFLIPVLIVLLFFVIFSPWRLGERELYWDEDYYAVQTLEVAHTPPVTFAHGEFNYKSAPFFPLIVSGLTKELNLPVELVLRLVSIAALAGIACMVWIAARNAAGVQAAVVATAVMISSNIVIEKAIDGYPDTLTILFLMAGWLLWFSLGVGRGQWSLAWLSGFFFCGLAFYTQGFSAVMYFLFPLIFMRRPMTIWRKLKYPGFVLGLLILLGFMLIWWVPHLVFYPEVKLQPLSFESETAWDYFEHFISFPFDVGFRFMPWTILAWVPFCVAFMPLDKTPIFSRFLRTLFFGIFFILWFMPDFNARDMLLLVPPIAILTGTHYGFFIRRYGRYFPPLFKYLGWISAICAMVIAYFYFAPQEWITPLVSVSRGIEFRHDFYNQANAVISICMITVIALILIFYRKLHIWTAFLLSSCITALFLWSVIVPYKSQAGGKKALGKQLKAVLKKEDIKPDKVIFKSEIKDLYGECYYMGYRVKKIYSLQELPKDEEIIYLISTNYPQVPAREWTNLLPKDMRYRGFPVCLWKGILKKRQFKKWPSQ